MTEIEIIEALRSLNPQTMAELTAGPDLCLAMEEEKIYLAVDMRTAMVRRIKHAGLTHLELADAIGFDERNLSQYLSGNRNIPLKYVERAVAVLQLWRK